MQHVRAHLFDEKLGRSYAEIKLRMSAHAVHDFQRRLEESARELEYAPAVLVAPEDSDNGEQQLLYIKQLEESDTGGDEAQSRLTHKVAEMQLQQQQSRENIMSKYHARGIMIAEEDELGNSEIVK